MIRLWGQFFVWLLLAAGIACPGKAATRTSAHYTITTESLEAGRISSSANYSVMFALTPLHDPAQQGSINLQSSFLAQINNPPSAGSFGVIHDFGIDSIFTLDALLGAIADIDGEMLTLDSFDPFSERGVALAFLGNAIRYRPPGALTGTDSFEYVVSDFELDEAIGTVQITLKGPAGPINYLEISIQPDGARFVRFVGNANNAFTLEWTDQLGQPWRELQGATRKPDGTIEFLERGADRTRFYRAQSPQ